MRKTIGLSLLIWVAFAFSPARASAQQADPANSAASSHPAAECTIDHGAAAGGGSACPENNHAGMTIEASFLSGTTIEIVEPGDFALQETGTDEEIGKAVEALSGVSREALAAQTLISLEKFSGSPAAALINRVMAVIADRGDDPSDLLEALAESRQVLSDPILCAALVNGLLSSTRFSLMEKAAGIMYSRYSTVDDKITNPARNNLVFSSLLLYSTCGKDDEVFRIISSIPEEEINRNSDLAVFKINNLLSRSENRKALEFCLGQVEMHPENSRMRLLAARLLKDSGNQTESLAQSKKAIETGGNPEECLLLMGQTLREMKLYDREAQCLKQLAALAPSNEMIRLDLARALNDAGQADEANLILIDLLQNSTNLPKDQITFLYAKVLYSQKRFKDALDTMGEIETSGDGNAEAALLKARILRERGNHAEAFKMFSDLVEADPAARGELRPYLAGTAWKFVLTGNWRQALAVLEDLARKSTDAPDSEDFANFAAALGMAVDFTGSPEQAKKLEALAEKPRDFAVNLSPGKGDRAEITRRLNALGVACLALGLDGKAVSFFEAALDEAPDQTGRRQIERNLGVAKKTFALVVDPPEGSDDFNGIAALAAAADFYFRGGNIEISKKLYNRLFLVNRRLMEETFHFTGADFPGRDGIIPVMTSLSRALLNSAELALGLGLSGDDASLDAAERLLRAVAKYEPTRQQFDDSLAGLATVALARKDWPAALAHLDRVSPGGAQGISMRRMRAFSLYRLGRYAEAAEVFVSLGEAAPEDRETALAFAEAALKIGKPSLAKARLDAFTAKNPEDLDGLILYAQILAKTAGTDKARAFLEEKAGRYRRLMESAPFLYALGKAAIVSGASDKGLETLKRAHDLDPRNTKILRDTVEAMRRENPNQALSFVKAVWNEPSGKGREESELLWNLSVEAGDDAAALEVGLFSLEKGFMPLKTVLDLSRIRFKQGNAEAAVSVVDALSGKGLEGPAAMRLKCEIYEAAEMWKALENYLAGLQGESSAWAEADYWRARLSAEKNDFVAARKHLEAFSAKGGDSRRTAIFERIMKK